MKKVLSFTLAVLIAVAVLPLWLLPTAAYDDTTTTPADGLDRPVTSADEYRTLQNTLYKLEKDNELTIAFIGDSIGCGQKPSPASELGIDGVNYSSRLTGTTVHQKYANVIYEWFQWYSENELGLDADIDAVYANWGGRTLRDMASYINETVLVHTPDLVIIEAWNVATEADGTKSGAYFLESMIQQIYATNPYADIMILDMGGDIVGNPTCKAVWEHYNIPIVKGMKTLSQLTMLNKDMWGQGATNPSWGFTNEAGVWIPATGSYFYNGGNPHVNEEAYSFVNMLFTNSVLKLFEEAKEGDLYGQYTVVQPDTKRIVLGEDGAVESYPTDTYYTSEGLFGGLFYRSDIIFADEFEYDAGIWTLGGTKPDLAKLYDAYSVVQGQYLSTSTTGASFTFDFYGSAFVVYGNSGSYTVSIDGVATGTTYTGQTVTIPASDEDAQHTVTITMTGSGSVYCVSTFAHTYTPVEKVERANEYYVNFFGKILDQYVHDNTYNGYAIIPNPLQWIAFGRSRVYEGAKVQVPTSSIIHAEAYDEAYGNFVGWVEADDVTFVNGNKIPTVNEYKYENGKIIDVATNEEKTVYYAGQYIDATRDMDLVAVYSFADDYTSKTVNYAQNTDSVADFLPQLSTDRAQENYVNGVDITSTSDKTEFTFDELYRKNNHGFGFSGAATNRTYWYYDEESDTVSATLDRWWGSPYYIQSRHSQTVSKGTKDGNYCLRIERADIGGNGYYQTVPYIVLPATNVTIGESVFVTVKYYYDTTNSTGNMVGKNAGMTINCTLNGANYSFNTTSNETIVGDTWATLTFDFTGKHIYYGRDVFETVKEATISSSRLFYSAIPTNFGTYQGTDNSRNGDVMYVGDFIYSFETPTVDVTYTNNGVTVKTETSQGEPVVLPSAIEGMVNEGYQLIGWTDGKSTYDVGSSETFYEDVTLEAVWAKIYTVTVSDGAGNSNVYTTIDKITLPDADEFTKENSGIIGWTDGSATYTPGQTITVSGDMTLTAVWETSYTVKFYNGTTLLSESVVAGSITLPAAPEAEGEAVFLGWSDGESIFSAGTTVDIVGDTTFTAQWMEKSDKITVNYADYYSDSSDIYDAWINYAYNTNNVAITASKFTEWGETTTTSAPWYQKYDAATDTQYIGQDRWWGSSYVAWYNFAIYNDEAEIDGVRGVSVKKYNLTYNNSTTAGSYVFDNGLGIEAEKDFNGYNIHMPMPVPTGITYENAKVITVKYYYDPANDTATNLVGKNAQLYFTLDSYKYVITSEETIVANQWSTLTFTLVGALFDNYGIADYNAYKDTDISKMGLIVDIGTNNMKNNDVFYVSEATFDKNFDIKMDHSVSFKNNLTLNYYVPDSEFDSCYDATKKADTLVADSLVLTVEKDVYDRNGNKTVETTTITEYTEETIDGELYYKFVYEGIAASEAGNEIRASITFDTVSTKNVKTTYTSAAEAYSVKTYAYNRLEASTNEAFKTLLVDTLNYCAAAQTYFGIRTDALVNADLTEEQRALGTQSDVEITKKDTVFDKIENASASVGGISIVFNSNVEMKFYMSFADIDMTGVVLCLTYTANGVETVKEIPASEFIYDEKQDCYTAKLTSLSAAELFEDVKIVILDGDVAISDTVTYNLETYIYNRLSASTNESFKALLRELAKYAFSAKAYF